MKEFRDDLAFFLRVNFAKTLQAAVLEFSNRLIFFQKEVCITNISRIYKW